MKKLLFLSLLTVSVCASTGFARVNIPPGDAKHYPVTQGEIISLEVIQDIADRNAAEVWGEVQGTEPIPYYWTDGEVIAYRFNYARGQAFPDPQQLKEQCAHRSASGDLQGQWGDGECMSSKPFAPFVMCDSAVCNVVNLAL